MARVSRLTTVDEAISLVLAHIPVLRLETVPIEAGHGRVLAAEAVAPVDLPLFASSSMDGFAVRAADTPGRLRLAGEAAAGLPATRALGVGEAMAISTGGVVPEGADAVVPVEHTETRAGTVAVGRSEPGAFVRPRGGDVRAGSVVVPSGASLTAARLAALAACGIPAVVCGARPRVAILATGSELRRPGERLAAGEIYESNALMLHALATSAGAQVTMLDAVRDDADALGAALAEGLAYDVLVSSGGVSAGPHDLVRGVSRTLGVVEAFHGVAMRPGKPVVFGTRGRTLVFGLPGNPVSSLVGAMLFLVPALRALQCDRDPQPRFATGVLAADAARLEGRDDFQRAEAVETDGGTLHLRPLPGQQSHMIAEAAAATALVRIPMGRGVLPAGSPVRYLSLEGGVSA